MLIERLLRLQAALEINDTALAKRLGISPALWTKLSADPSRARYSVALLAGTLRAFPDLIGVVAEELVQARGDDEAA